MAKIRGNYHKGVEEKRRSLPIYQHYTLSPGKTKSHHPEAKCNHCLKEFVCGSKQRLIRHLRKCNSISNPDQIIAETLNTLARNSATGTLNHSILEASNLLPSQISQHSHHSTQQQLIGQQQIHSSATTTANNSNITSNNMNNINNSSNHNNTIAGCNDLNLVPGNSSNGLNLDGTPTKRAYKRGRRPTGHLQLSSSSGIHVTTGLDGKTHFSPASQLPNSASSGQAASPIISQLHNGQSVSYNNFHSGSVTSSSASVPATSGAHLNVACANSNNNSSTYKLNLESIDKAYLKLVLTRNLPLSLCDTKEFQMWIKTFANDYKPPSSINLIAQNLKNEAQIARQRINNILVKAPKKTINLELHSWHDPLREHSWYAVVATLDYKRLLISIKDIYSLRQSSQPIHEEQNNEQHQLDSDSPGKMLTEFLDGCIRRVSSDRINSLVFSGHDDDVSATISRQSIYSNHPSIVTHYCWWHFTNLLCSDIIQHNEHFQAILRNSNRMIDFLTKRPRLCQNMEKFNPFAGGLGTISPMKTDRRWYSHLVCYLLDYIRNNREAIVGALEGYSTSTQSHLSDNNNNSSSASNNDESLVGGVMQRNNNSSTQHQTLMPQEDSYVDELKSMVLSSDYWDTIDLLSVYIKPIQQIVALTSTVNPMKPNLTSNQAESSTPPSLTSNILSTVAANLSLSEYMNWFLNYGKTLFTSWRQSPDAYKYQLIASYLSRFFSSLQDFKLLLAAYLLNPKFRCAYTTQKAKDAAIEEILNIASEFMPEESDGHTIFDQWKLYLVREEPYDMVFEPSRISPLDWWISLPCAESIRRVALRILRLKAFATPKPEAIFSQLYFYEDETRIPIENRVYEDLAVVRYYYDHEDKIGQPNGSLYNYNLMSNPAASFIPLNGCHDRSQIGLLHSNEIDQLNQVSNYLPASNTDIKLETNGQLSDSNTDVDGRYSNISADGVFSGVVVESYLGHNPHLNIDSVPNMNSNELVIENLPGYEVFTSYIDYDDTGVQIIEEPTEKKRRKWTAQEILSKCQQSNNNKSTNSDNAHNNVINTK